MTILFWIKDDCVLSIEDIIHPKEGDKVRLDCGVHKGYYRVTSLLWSYRKIPTAIAGRLPMEDYRLEVHLEPW